ncbi:hypothetical protein C9F11_44150 (plasmid) [Streptomyces sp. YIM 121038]|nr:hypothetical protein C9F11_44150 [Streptomyces sp. YIM 121038]
MPTHRATPQSLPAPIWKTRQAEDALPGSNGVMRTSVPTAVFLAAAIAFLTAAAPTPQMAGAAAEVAPNRVVPGEQVTVSVTCPVVGGALPETMVAVSRAFEPGSVQLQQVQNPTRPPTGATYQGTARIAGTTGSASSGPNTVGDTSEWSVDGTCPGDGQWQATFIVTRTASPTSSLPAPTTPLHTTQPSRHGVHAGGGGSFTDSPAALAVGGACIAGALGLAVQRLRRSHENARSRPVSGVKEPRA